MPVSTSIPFNKLSSIISDYKIKIIISDDSNIKLFNLNKLNVNLLNINKIKNNESINSLNFDFDFSDIAYCIFTSGSTGKPKGVQIKFSSLIKRIIWQKKKLNNNSKSFFIHKTSISFDVSLWEIFLPVYCDAPVYVCDEKESIHPILLNSLINKYKVTDIHFIPSMLHNYLKFNKIIPKSLLNIVCSGEELKPYHFIGLSNFRKVNLWNFYGPTETTIDVLYYKVNINENYTRIPLGECVDDTNYKLIIHDEINSKNILYKLLISGDLLSTGYLNDKVLTSEKFYKLDNILYYDTGDLVTFSNNNIYFHSRLDNQIKLNGIRIEINEIETVLSKCANNSFVIVLPIKLKNNKIILSAFLNSERQNNEILYKNFCNYLDKSFFPKSLIFSKSIPRLSNGKVDFKCIKNRLTKIAYD